MSPFKNLSARSAREGEAQRALLVEGATRVPYNLKNKKVIVLGFGKEGRAMTNYLLGQGARVTVSDEKEPNALGDAYREFQGKNIDWRLGPAHLQGLEDFSVIVRSPGIPLSLSALKRAKAKGIEITSLTKIFFDVCPAPIIGITGTKGKGTTTTLIAEMLKASKCHVHVVGNIGTPAIDILPKIKKTDWVVYELSSFQLQDLTHSPHIAVVLGLTVDHQDYHKTPREYFEAKSSIVKFQKPKDAAIFEIDYRETRRMEKYAKARVLYASRKTRVRDGAYIEDGWVVRVSHGKTEKIIACADVGLKGEHNLENVTAAVAAASAAGASVAAMRRVIKSFRGLPHRLEPVGIVDGIEYWNNSFGTTPETTIAAIRAFNEPIVLLLGGSEKGQSYKGLGPAFAKSTVKAVIGIGLTAPKMYDEIKKFAKLKKKKPPAFVDGGKTMPEMVATARRFAKAGDVVLLAPGAASFDRFNNYIERGELFRAAALKK